MAGDPYYVPWLIAKMQDPAFSRLAGEAFSFIAGVDLQSLGLAQKPPEVQQLPGSDSSDDDELTTGEDEDLPWPDAEKIAAWWRAHADRFASGTRYFMGGVPTREVCLKVLRSGSSANAALPLNI